MPAPRKLRKSDEDLLTKFEFEVSTPPPKPDTRKSKYDDIFEAAKKFTMGNPGVTIKVREFTSTSNAYNVAKQINNGEHRAFKEDASNFIAVSRKIGTGDDDTAALWLTYNLPDEE